MRAAWRRAAADAWRSFRDRNTAPCTRCHETIWFGGQWPEHGRCIAARLRDDQERRRARLIAEELRKLGTGDAPRS